MILRVPHYYRQFKCIASDCKDNCCMGGWEIDIDAETAKKYLELPGHFGDRLRDSIETIEGEYCFKLTNGQCPFLDDRNLCQIYKELGEAQMGVVCTQFPRFTEYYGSVKETGIGLACEEAERIIFEDKESFSYEEIEIDEEETEDSEYDMKLAEILWKVRAWCVNFLEGEGTIAYKLINLLELSSLIQHEINQNNYSDIENILENYVCINEAAVGNVRDGIDRIICAYEQLEPLNDDWTDTLENMKKLLYSDEISDEQYNELHKKFDEYMASREFEYLNLLKYYLFRYLMKASYDHSVYEKIQLMTTNYLMIREFDIARYMNNNYRFSFQDRIDTVHIFSREVEYSEDNLEELAEEFLFDDIFQKENLQHIIK